MSANSENNRPGSSQPYTPSESSSYTTLCYSSENHSFATSEDSTDFGNFLKGLGIDEEKKGQVQLSQENYLLPPFFETCPVNLQHTKRNEYDNDIDAADGSNSYYQRSDTKEQFQQTPLEAGNVKTDKTKRLLQENTENKLMELKLDMANKKMETLELEAILEHLRINERGDEAKVLEHYKKQLTAANSTILQLKRQLEEAEKNKCEELTSSKINMQRKLEEFEKELEDSYKKNKILENQIKANGKLEIEALKEKLLLSEMANEWKQNEITALQSQLAKTVQTSDNASLQRNLSNALLERDQIATELEATNAQLVNTKTKLEYLEQLLQHTLTNLNTQIVPDCERKAKEEILRARRRIAELEEQLQAVQSDLLDAKRQSNPGELAHIRKQLVDYQSALTDATQKRIFVEAQLANANREIERLSTELVNAKGSENDLFVLQAQLDMFRTDFEDEHQSRMEEKNKSEKLSKELQQIQRSNQLLQEELELLRRECRKEVSRPQKFSPKNSEGKTQASKQNQTIYSYKCPKCSFKFDDLNDAEVHINSCLDLTDTLP